MILKDLFLSTTPEAVTRPICLSLGLAIYDHSESYDTYLRVVRRLFEAILAVDPDMDCDLVAVGYSGYRFENDPAVKVKFFDKTDVLGTIRNNMLDAVPVVRQCGHPTAVDVTTDVAQKTALFASIHSPSLMPKFERWGTLDFPRVLSATVCPSQTAFFVDMVEAVIFEYLAHSGFMDIYAFEDIPWFWQVDPAIDRCLSICDERSLSMVSLYHELLLCKKDILETKDVWSRWSGMMDELTASGYVTPVVLKVWLEDIVPLTFHNGILSLRVKDVFNRSIISTRYTRVLEDAATKAFGCEVRLQFVLPATSVSKEEND